MNEIIKLVASNPHLMVSFEVTATTPIGSMTVSVYNKGDNTGVSENFPQTTPPNNIVGWLSMQGCKQG